MSSLKKIKDRIQSIQSTKQITSSMKMVAVSRLKKKHKTFLEAIPYANEMNRVVRRLVRSMKLRQENLIWENNETPLVWPKLLNGNGKEKKYLIVMMTSDEGLSGSSAMQVVIKTRQVIDYLKRQDKSVFVVAYGARGADILKRFYPDMLIVSIKSKKSKELSGYRNAERLVSDVIEAFYQNKFDMCLIIYNQFKSVVSQVPIIEQAIPNTLFLKENPWAFLNDSKKDYEKKDVVGQRKITLKKSLFLSAIGGVDVVSSLKGAIFKTNLKGGKRSPAVYDYEPSDNDILEAILPQYLTAYFYRVILESDVSDNAARLMVMDNATRNAGDMLEKLDRLYKRTRQSRITTDITEASSGFL